MNSVTHSIAQAAQTIKQGGVIAYPTEYCYGLGCDPSNEAAVDRILKIKHRQRDKGLIVIAATQEVVSSFVELETSPFYADIGASWPGPNTWLLPAHDHVGDWLTGRFSTLAVRIPDHAWCLQLCDQLQGGLVSTSANRQGEPELLNYADVVTEFEAEVDLIIDQPVGGRERASIIRDGASGEQLR
jgi:L-threonylcarbamoyladenylate synthase